MLAKDAAHRHRDGRSARGARRHPREARAPLLHRGAAGVEAARLRYGSAPIPCRAVEAADGTLELELSRPAAGGGPGAAGVPACRATGSPAMGRSWKRTVTADKELIDLDAPLSADFQPVIRLIIGGIAERVDFAFEEIDDLQLAVERLLAEAGARDTVHLRFEVGEEAIRTRVGPLDERAHRRRAARRRRATGPAHPRRILQDGGGLVRRGGRGRRRRDGAPREAEGVHVSAAPHRSSSPAQRAP